MQFVVTARSVAGIAPSVCTAVPAANVSASSVPVNSCAFQMTKPMLPYVTCDFRVPAVDTETQQCCGALSVGQQVLSADEARHRVQQSTTAARSLLALSQRGPVQHLSKSTDRMTTDSQHVRGQPVDVHGSNVQRSHSFTTTSPSHQPPTNIGLRSTVLFSIVVN